MRNIIKKTKARKVKTIKKPDGQTAEVEDDYTLQEGEEFVEPEGNGKRESKEEIKLGKILDGKINLIVEAIKATPVRTKIIGVQATAERSVMETDSFLRKTRPFVQLSGEMVSFISDLKVLAKGGIPQSLTKALQESDDTAGGFLVPEEFQAEVIRFATEAAIVRPRARVFPMASNTLTLPKLDQSNYKFAGIDIHWEGDEGEKKEESQLVFGRITLKVGKMIGLCPVSDDLLQDSAINLANFLVAIFGEAIAYEEDKQFLNGNGMKKPLGIVSCGVAVNRQTASKISYEDLKNMAFGLPAWADAGAVWITTKKGMQELLDIRSEDSIGFPLLLPGFSIAAGLPPTILGYPWVMTDKLPAVGIKGDIILGDLAAYFIGDRGGLMVASSIHDRFRYDETVFRFVKRVDGQCALTKAFVVLDDPA